MIRVLLDVNVVLDVLANREPFAKDAEALLGLAQRGVLEGVIAAHTVTTLYYLLASHLGRARTKGVLSDLLQILDVVPVDGDRLRLAFAMDWPDFEDAVQAACAEKEEVHYLATRDKKGFKQATSKVVTPAELLALIK